jgi:hypothetical protein
MFLFSRILTTSSPPFGKKINRKRGGRCGEVALAEN